jgi:NTE family protein
MDTDLLASLKASRVFSSLDENASTELLSKLSKVTLTQNDILFYQGDPSDSVYLLLSGKLSASLTTPWGDTRVVGYIEPYEMVGELGALTNEPRSLTIKALTDASLLKLSTSDFNEICHRHSAVMFATLYPIVTRSTSLMQLASSEKANKHIVLVPANASIDLVQLSEAILGYSGKFPNLLIVSDYQEEFKNKLEPILSVREKVKKLALNKKPSAKILYLLSGHDTPLASVAFKRMNAIYIVACSSAVPKIDHHILDKVNSRRIQLRTNPDLVLLHPESALKPKNTAAWLSQTDFGLHHHVRRNKVKDLQRLLRFIRGRAVGLVLSGGGTRGWAHVGVIKALRESKIPIDIVGGTSAGAAVAACYAMNESYVDTYDTFYDLVTGSKYSISWRNLTWPIISLFNARNFTRSQQKAFGDAQIEDLWLPFFCVSCNLTKNKENIHRSGTLWKKIRASTSLPGIVPPMVIDNEIHLDGGLVNNLPVDIMRQMIGAKGKIIAVELNKFVTQPSHYDFPPILTIKEILASKWGFRKNKYIYPSFIDTFMRGLFISSSSRTMKNIAAANVFINLDLSRFKMLDSTSKQADLLVEIGYEAVMKEIHQK